MKIVKVTYTTRGEFAVQNSENIKAVMGDLQKLNRSGIKYTATLGADNRTFMHLAFFESDADQQALFSLPSFKLFQEELKASQPETSPKNDVLTLVGSSYQIF